MSATTHKRRYRHVGGQYGPTRLCDPTIVDDTSEMYWIDVDCSGCLEAGGRRAILSREFAPRDDVTATLRTRRVGIGAHIPSRCFAEQKHLDEGTAERAYWHYGYYAALTDVLLLLAPSTVGSGGSDAEARDPQGASGPTP